MPLSSIELWQRITAEGLADTNTCRRWAAEAARYMQAADALDGVKVLQQLVALEILTHYQAQTLSSPSSRPLRQGPWIIRQPVEQSPFTGWLEVGWAEGQAAEEQANVQPGKLYWVKALGLQDLQALKAAGPSLTRCRQLAQVSDPCLLQSFGPERLPMDNATTLDPNLQHSASQLLMRCDRSEICLATDHFSSSRPSVLTVFTILTQISQGLSALHRNGLVHGRVLPDRISWDGKRALLITDPLCGQTATFEEKGILDEALGDLHPMQFLAPEFAAPGQSPTPATDVFAFGCTWWWLLTGLPRVNGRDPQAVIQAHSTGLEPLPKELGLPMPLQRILAHCLAPNPSARFRSAVELNQALISVADKLDRKQPSSSAVAPQPSASIMEKPPHRQQTPKAQKARRTEASRLPTKSNPESAALAREAVQEEAVDEKGLSQGRLASELAAKPTATQASHSPLSQQREKPTQPKMTKESSTPTPGRKQVDRERATSASPRAEVQARSNKLTSEEQRSQRIATASIKASAAGNKSRSGIPRRKRRQASKKWMIPVVGGCGFLVLLLLALKFSGALDRSSKPSATASKPPYVAPPSPAKAPEERDPRLDFYELSPAEGTQLWAPPFAPEPIDLSLLPPGSGMFMSLRLADISTSILPEQLAAIADMEFVARFQQILSNCSLNPHQVSRMTIAFYPPLMEGEFPQMVTKLELSAGMPTDDLLAGWKVIREPADSRLLISGETALYLKDDDAIQAAASQESETTDTVTSLAIGPAELLAEVQEMDGAPPPMLPALEKLWQWTSRDSDILLLTSPSFLFTDGRGVWQSLPTKLEAIASQWLERDVRASLVQSDLSPDWYIEWQILASSGPISGKIAEALLTSIQELPNQIENWFISQPPSPAWRGLAFRYPQMLRLAVEYTRVGIEDEVTIVNTYLPTEAASNLLLSSWLAMQPGATLSTAAQALAPTADVSESPSSTPQRLDEFLARPIRLSFDQEPIEEALRLVGLEANDGLPPSQAWRFELDGDAFELAGITRNQQLRDFSIENQPVRAALTELAKLGNPVTTVQDTREEDQRLVWTVKPDPTAPGRDMISLTTRDAARKAELSLPREFSADSEL
ncbi:MAG: protein kinase [bacterium]|nr:protein kinase [bacterium]